MSYEKPTVETLETESVVESLGPAQGLSSGANAGSTPLRMGRRAGATRERATPRGR